MSPAYEFFCKECDKITTDYISYNESLKERTCEKCNSKVERLFPTGTNYKFNCLGSSKDIKHREEQQARRLGVWKDSSKKPRLI